MDTERILHYRILGPLGQGGMGEVVLAEDERLGRRVALKFLSRATAADPQARDRLHREARSLAALSHPHIAAIYALEESGERLFLVMEYIEGSTLADVIARRPLPVEDALTIGLAMADGLAHAHARGVIHRDVKPANILIRSDGSAVLTDFGIADLESATRLTAEGYTPGTVAYMSPEQARGARVDARSDLFSLGAVLYEALTGVRPFTGDRPESALYAVQHHEPEPVTARRTGIPLELERIVLKLLRKDPALRTQHADDLAADLRALRGSTVPSAAAPAARATAMDATATVPTASTVDSVGRVKVDPRSDPDAALARGKRTRRAAILAVAGLLCLALVYLAGRPGGDHDHGTAEAAEKSIAVLSFQNLAEPGDPSGTSPMATSLLSVGLGETQAMPVVSAQRIHAALRDLGKNGTDVRGGDALEVARKAGASHVITGFIYSLVPEVVLGAEVASTADGKVLTATRVRTPAGPTALFTAVDSLTRSLTEGLARSGFLIRSSGVDVAKLTTQDPAAYRAYARGLDKLYAGATEEAGRDFMRAVQADSTFALAWYYAAIAFWWSGEYDSADDEVRVALRVGNRLTSREREGLAALDALIRGEYSSAAKAYSTLLDRYPHDKEFAYGLGEAFYHQGVHPAARSAFEQAVGVDPSFGVAYIHLIDIAIENRSFDAALAYCAQLEAADPDHAGLHLLRGKVLAARGDGDGALASYRRALASNPTLPHPLFEIARIHVIEGRLDSAQVAIDQLRRMGATPTWQDARMVQLVGTGRYGEAVRLYRSIPPEDLSSPARRRAPVRQYYFSALLERGQVEEVTTAIRAFHRNTRAARALGRGVQMDELAEIMIHQGRLAEAEKLLPELDRLLADTPDYRELENRRYIEGILALARGRPREAIPLLERNKPMSSPGRFQAQRADALSRAYMAVGDTARAISELEWIQATATITLDVHSLFQTMANLASLYERTGRREEALGIYRRLEAQYRGAEPGCRLREIAVEGIRRLSRA